VLFSSVSRGRGVLDVSSARCRCRVASVTLRGERARRVAVECRALLRFGDAFDLCFKRRFLFLRRRVDAIGYRFEHLLFLASFPTPRPRSLRNELGVGLLRFLCRLFRLV